MNLMRKDCFASRLGEAQRAELLAALEGGMTLGEAAAWAHERSVPKRKTPPSEASVCKWFGQERRARAMREWMNAERGSRNGEVRLPRFGGQTVELFMKLPEPTAIVTRKGRGGREGAL